MLEIPSVLLSNRGGRDRGNPLKDPAAAEPMR